MKKNILLSSLVATALFITISSCDKDTTPAITIIEKTDSLRVNFSSNSPYTFFNFKNGSLVSNTDSATSKWDFGLRFTTFIINSNASGPGNAGVILQNNIYSSVNVAPDLGYAYDTTSAKKAVVDGSWYNYNSATRSFSPKAGQTFVFRTADNYYVKMELLKVDYDAFVGQTPTKLIYRFRFSYQANASKSF